MVLHLVLRILDPSLYLHRILMQRNSAGMPQVTKARITLDHLGEFLVLSFLQSELPLDMLELFLQFSLGLFVLMPIL